MLVFRSTPASRRLGERENRSETPPDDAPISLSGGRLGRLGRPLVATAPRRVAAERLTKVAPGDFALFSRQQGDHARRGANPQWWSYRIA